MEKKKIPMTTKKIVSGVLAFVIGISCMGPLFTVMSSANFTSFDYIEKIKKEKSGITSDDGNATAYNVLEITPDSSQSAMSYYVDPTSTVKYYAEEAAVYMIGDTDYDAYTRQTGRKLYMANYFQELVKKNILSNTSNTPVTMASDVSSIYKEAYPWEADYSDYIPLTLSEPDKVTVKGTATAADYLNGNYGDYDMTAVYSLSNIFDFDTYASKYSNLTMQYANMPALNNSTAGDYVTLNTDTDTVSVNSDNSGSNDLYTSYDGWTSYYMTAEANTTYTLSYDLDTTGSAQIFAFQYDYNMAHTANWSSACMYVSGSNSYSKTFTTDSNTAYFQIRVGTTSQSTRADFSNIKIIKDGTTTNLFNFDTWASKFSYAPKYGGGTNAISNMTYGDRIIINTSEDSLSLVTDGSHSANEIYTPYGDWTYYMAVSPDTEYTVSYSLSGSSTSMNTQFYVFQYDESMKEVTHSSDARTSAGDYSFSVTTKSNTKYIQIRFDNNAASQRATFSDIQIIRTGKNNYTQSIKNFKYVSLDYKDTASDYYYAVSATRIGTEEAWENIGKNTAICKLITETDSEGNVTNQYYNLVGITGSGETLELDDASVDDEENGITSVYYTLSVDTNPKIKNVYGEEVSIPVVTNTPDEYHRYLAVQNTEDLDTDGDGTVDRKDPVYNPVSVGTGYFESGSEVYTYNPGKGKYNFVASDDGTIETTITTYNIAYSFDLTCNEWFEKYVFNRYEGDAYYKDSDGEKIDAFDVDVVTFDTGDLYDESTIYEKIQNGMYDLIVIDEGCYIFDDTKSGFTEDISENTKKAILTMTGSDNMYPIVFDADILGKLDKTKQPNLYSLLSQLADKETVSGNNASISDGGVSKNFYAYSSSDISSGALAFATNLFNTNMSGASALSSPYYDVYSEINSENLFRKAYGKTDLIDEDNPVVSEATCIRAIINYPGSRVRSSVNEIRVLDIEPYTSRSYLEFTDTEISKGIATLSAMEVISWLPETLVTKMEDGSYNFNRPGVAATKIESEEDAEKVIKITTMSVAELNTWNEEIMENFDMVYVGSSVDTLYNSENETQNRATVDASSGEWVVKYNDDNMRDTTIRGKSFNSDDTAEYGYMLYSNIGDTYTDGNVQSGNFAERLVDGETNAGLLREDYNQLINLTVGSTLVQTWNLPSDYEFEARTDGNDISKKVLDELNEFAAAGLPVVYADELVEQPKSAESMTYYVEIKEQSSYRNSSQNMVYFIGVVMDGNNEIAKFPRGVTPEFDFYWTETLNGVGHSINRYSDGDEVVGSHTEPNYDGTAGHNDPTKADYDGTYSLYGTTGGMNWDGTIGADVTYNGNTIKNFHGGMAYTDSGQDYQATVGKGYFYCKVTLKYSGLDATYDSLFNGEEGISLSSDKIKLANSSKNMAVTYTQTNKQYIGKNSLSNAIVSCVSDVTTANRQTASRSGSLQTLTFSPNPLKNQFFALNDTSNSYGSFYSSNFGTSSTGAFDEADFSQFDDASWWTETFGSWPNTIDMERRLNFWVKSADVKNDDLYDDNGGNEFLSSAYWDSNYISVNTNATINTSIATGYDHSYKALVNNTSDTLTLLYDCTHGTGTDEDQHYNVTSQLEWQQPHWYDGHFERRYYLFGHICYIEMTFLGKTYFLIPSNSTEKDAVRDVIDGDNYIYSGQTAYLPYTETIIGERQETHNKVSLAQDMTPHISLDAVDNTSNMYEFMSQTYNTVTLTSADLTALSNIGLTKENLGITGESMERTKFPNVFSVTDIKSDNGKLLGQCLQISPPSIVVSEDKLQSYDEQHPESLTNNTLKVTFHVECDTNITECKYKVYLFLDEDHNAVFSDDEAKEITNIKADGKALEKQKIDDERVYVVKGNPSSESDYTEYVLEKSIPSTYQGVLPWKIEIVDTEKPAFHDSYTGYAYMTQEDATVIHALQILPADHYSNIYVSDKWGGNDITDGTGNAGYTIRGAWVNSGNSEENGNEYYGSVFLGTDSMTWFSNTTDYLHYVFLKQGKTSAESKGDKTSETDTTGNFYTYTSDDYDNDAFLQLIKEDGTKLQRTVYYEDVTSDPNYARSNMAYRTHVVLWVNPRGEQVPMTDAATGAVETDYFNRTIYKYTDCDFEVDIALTDIYELDTFIYPDEDTYTENIHWLDSYDNPYYDDDCGFDMLIMGFGDSYGKCSTSTKVLELLVSTLGFSTYAAWAIETYINDGNPVLFCHDTTNTEVNFIKYYANDALSWFTKIANKVSNYYLNTIVPAAEKVWNSVKNWWYKITGQNDKITEWNEPVSEDNLTEIENNVQDSRVKNGYYNNLILRVPLKLDRYGITYVINKIMSDKYSYASEEKLDSSGNLIGHDVDHEEKNNQSHWQTANFKAGHYYTWLLNNYYQERFTSTLNADGKTRTYVTKSPTRIVQQTAESDGYVNQLELLDEGYTLAYSPGSAFSFVTSSAQTVVLYDYYKEKEYTKNTFSSADYYQNHIEYEKDSNGNEIVDADGNKVRVEGTKLEYKKSSTTGTYTNYEEYTITDYTKTNGTEREVILGGQVEGTYVQQTQGFTKWTIARYGTNDDELLPVGVRKTNGADPIYTTAITQVNKGQITTYPYDINTSDFGGTTDPKGDGKIPIKVTHEQPYQINLSDPETIVWYCLADPSGTKHSDANYDLVSNDGANSYYIFTSGNLTYTGAGHTNSFTIEEAKLFINTLIAAYRTKTEDATVRFLDENGDKTISYALVKSGSGMTYDSETGELTSSVGTAEDVDDSTVVSIQVVNPNLDGKTTGQLTLRFGTSKTDSGVLQDLISVGTLYTKYDQTTGELSGDTVAYNSGYNVESETIYYFKVPTTVVEAMEDTVVYNDDGTVDKSKSKSGESTYTIYAKASIDGKSGSNQPTKLEYRRADMSKLT